jgi:hypothetical protein
VDCLLDSIGVAAKIFILLVLPEVGAGQLEGVEHSTGDFGVKATAGDAA